MSRIFLFALVLATGSAIGAGLMVVGGPAYARLEKQDQQRERDLSALHNFLRCRQGDQVLPETLDDPDYCPSHSRQVNKADPATAQPYTYRRLSDTRFEVCATFATYSQDRNLELAARGLVFEGTLGCKKGIRLERKSAFTPMEQFAVIPSE